MTLPSAPPSTSDKPIARINCSEVRIFRSHSISTTLTINASAMKNQRCQPPASCSMLNAAPRFSR
jgi:hypothetical protein